MLISVHFKLIKQNKSTAMRCMDNTALPCRISPTFSLLPQRAVPVSGTRSQGGYSLLKRECPPGPPKEKRGGISISPRTPLKRHKGRGPWPPPLETNPQGDGGRGQGPSPLETPPGVGRGSGSGKRSRGCPICTPTSAIPPDAGTHLGHLRIFSAAGRRLSFWQQSVPAAPSYG